MTDIPELERRLAEANANVAEAFAEYRRDSDPISGLWKVVEAAHQEREAALAALEEARRPKPALLSPEEAEEIWDKYADGTEISEVIGPILTAVHERAYAVIEALPDDAGYRGMRNIVSIKRALGVS